MLLYRPMYRHSDQMSKPPNLTEAEAIEPGLTPLYAESAASVLDVQTPAGEKLAIDDPKLIQRLHEGLRDRHELKLIRSNRALTDCRPVSMISIQTVRQLSDEVEANLDKRRFRANIYVDLSSGGAFDEKRFVGNALHIGAKVVIAITDEDLRCKMITLDPDTGQANPEVMRCVARKHDGKAAVYGAVLVQGIIRPGDSIKRVQ